MSMVGPKERAGMTQVRAIWEYTDIAGNFLRASNWVYATPGLSVLESAIQSATNGNLLYATNGLPVVGTTTPTDAQYPLVADLATFNFSTAAGSGLQLVIPAPQASLFLPNSFAVDATATLSAAIIAAAIGTLGDVAGNAASAFAGGSKVSRRVEQVG